MFRPLTRLMVDRRGAVSPMLTLMLIPMIAVLGLATEASGWFFAQRSMQNAADSAALAAATNGCDASEASCVTAMTPYYDAEAASVASEFGFVNGEADTTVTASNTATCPNGDTNCYSVTITRMARIGLVRIVGFDGDSVTGDGSAAQLVRAVAIARPRGPATGFCLIGLGGGNAVRINGGPFLDLDGCDIHSNGNAVCNGSQSDTGVDYGYAVGSSSCGDTEVPGVAPLADPYEALNANPPIPNDTCGGVYLGATLAAGTSFSSAVKKCGNTTLTGNVTVNSANSILAIYNGSLNLNGFTLSTAPGASLTIIFTAFEPTNTGSTTYEHYLTGSGTLDIAAPTSGDFSGVAMMQDKRLNGSKNLLNYTYHGNDPTLNIQGLIYFPNADFDIRGAINLHSGGLSCLGVVARTILASGTGAVFNNATSDCLEAGLVLPTIPGTNSRQALVQ
ncbi:TadE/TadG family type IV pilus assembly protein [Phenylobacterium sp.]|uniref:TadE/TadG family type IV pilus assembly protein n=1 Tax=Phenylobacterium sp. TaxID=1871053 RepID=UPI00273722D2|nr:pilus assembly protein TadG-related protein [Phenylobacterium sp.]MDP3852262.1 pilus assembly protein TadG-related protein [Phenylobacterium sp.]